RTSCADKVQGVVADTSFHAGADGDAVPFLGPRWLTTNSKVTVRLLERDYPRKPRKATILPGVRDPVGAEVVTALLLGGQPGSVNRDEFRARPRRAVVRDQGLDLFGFNDATSTLGRYPHEARNDLPQYTAVADANVRGLGIDRVHRRGSCRIQPA